MAEFLNQLEPVDPSPDEHSGFNAMGKPVPTYRKKAGYDNARQMGCDENSAWGAVEGMSNALEHDNPYGAIESGMRYLDLNGCYRLMAVLLTARPAKPRYRIPAGVRRGE